jgi:rhamnosyltransferase
MQAHAQQPGSSPRQASQFGVTVGVIIPTLHAAAHLPRNLPQIRAAACAPQVLVVDSCSQDNTVALAQQLGARTIVIDRRLFNHGATREWARRQLQTDIIVMLSQDVYPTGPADVDRLIAPIVRGQAAVSYGRQVAGKEAGFFERFRRDFNYGPDSQLRSLEDASQYGVGTFFCSNAFSAYLNAALDQIGGFEPVLTHEDAIAAARLLRHGYRIAYVADAIVEHTHHRSLWQEMRCYWEAGYVRSEHHRLLSFGAGHEEHGRRYARSLLKTVAHRRPWLIPYALAELAAKWTGFQLGCRSHRAPASFKRLMSVHRGYWSSPWVSGLHCHAEEIVAGQRPAVESAASSDRNTG